MTQYEALIHHFDAGGTLTVGEALEKFGIYALSQRCQELVRVKHYPVASEFVELPSGARVKRYWKGME